MDIVTLDGRAVGAAQLRLAQQPNARHRAEVTKVLVLDTIAGSDAARLYERLGWTALARSHGPPRSPTGASRRP